MALAAVEGEAPVQILDGVFKWFDPDKGFGFIVSDATQEEIFIHAETLRKNNFLYSGFNYEAVRATVEAIREPRQGRLRCSRVVSLDLTDIQAARQSHRSSEHLLPNVLAKKIRGPEQMQVKWLNDLKGYGFFERPGKPDVFFHKVTLQRCGISALSPGQEMYVQYGPNEDDPKRGLTAVNIRYAP